MALLRHRVLLYLEPLIRCSYTLSNNLNLGTRRNSSSDQPLRLSFAKNSRMVVHESEEVDQAMTQTHLSLRRE